MLHVGRAGAPGFGIAMAHPLRVPDVIRHRLAATASLSAIAIAAGPGEAAASGLLDGFDAAPDSSASIEAAGVQPALVPVGSDATHAYFLDSPAEEGNIDRRIGDAFSDDRDTGADAGAPERPVADSQTYALTAGQRILNAFGAAPDPLSVGPKWGPYIDFIARPGTPTSTGTIDLFVPVAQADDWLVFLNARGTLTSEPSQEAGLGGGVRHIVPDFIFGQDTILGVYGFVDFRNSSNGNSFVQGTIGAELITERFEVRINGYLPGSRTYTVAGSTRAGVALQGTNVVLTNTLRQEQALPGFDVEAGLRFELDPDTILRVSGGYYRFARGGTKVEGGLGRVEVQFDDPFGFDGASLSVGGELRNDNYNGTHGNATLRFRMPLGTSRNGGDEGAGFGDINDLMVRPVQRFDNIVAPEVDGPTQEAGPATDAATGQTLQVFHVAQTAQGTGDCSSVQNACTFTVAQSLAGAGDTFLAVDIAGDIASAFALNAANQRVVGAGDTGTVNVPLTDALNSVLMLGGLGGRPTVAGVDFGANADPFVRGIATNGAGGIGGDGFTGTATIDDVRSTNGGLSFQNTGATINISNSAFNGGAGLGVALTNLTGAFTMTGSTVTSTGGGFRIDGGNGAISHDGAVTQNGAASAIDVRNRTGGTVTFGGPVTANTGTATGINLQNNAGTIAFTGGLDIDTTTGTGFSATGGGTVNVSNEAVANSVNATAGQAIDIDGVGGSLTFSTIASTGAPGDAVAIDNFGAGATFRVTGATAIATPGEDGIDIDNVAGTVAFDGAVTVTTPTDDGVDMDDVTGLVTFSGPVTVTNPGDDGIDIEDSFNATLAFNGPVAITGAGGNGIELNGPGGVAPTAGSLTFGGSTTITNPTLGGVLAVDRIGAVTFADLDIALQTNGSAGLVLAGATINGNFTATDFDVTSTTNTGTAGVVLSGTTGPGTIQLGDSNVAGASASIAGVAAGVVFNAASNATFIFGDGESPTDQGSAITATTAIQGGSLVTTGSYDFDDVVFTGALDFTAGGGGNLVFVAATATGDGSGSDVNNRANVVTADAIATANTTFVLINDGAAIDDVDGFTLSHNQTMASFGNGRTFATGGLIIPGNFSGVPGAGAAITDPTGNGAATLTNTGAGDTLTALGGVTIQDFIIENTAGGDGLAGVGAIGINSTGLTIRNITAGQGIDLDNVTGTATFNDTTIATTVGNAVDIDNSTVSFTGNLDIDTTTGTGFNATGGSTVSVAAAGTQTIDSAGGLALNLNMATIGGGGFNFDTVSGTGGSRAINLNNVTTSAGNGINIGRANALNNTVQGIAIGSVTGAGGVTIVAADIDNPTNSGIGITGVNTGATFNIGTGTSNGLTGLNIDGGTIGLFLSQNGADLNIGTGTGFLRIGETTAPTLVGVDNDGAAAGEALNIGNATNASRINSGGRGMDIFGRPTLAVTNLDVTNAGTEGVHLGNYGGTATFDDLTVQGIDGASNAVNIVQNSNASTLTFNDLAISNFDGGATGGGFVANVSGTGTTNITFGGAGTTISSPGAAVEINNTTGNAASVVLALDNLTLTRTSAGFTLDVDGGVTDGATIVTSLNGLTITGNGTSGGAQFDRVTFDAVPGGAIQQATGTGTTQIGQGVGTRVAGDGLRLNNVLGDIALGTLNVFNDSGTGLFIRDAAGKAGAFAFGNTGGVIDTTTGASVDIDPVTMSSTFASLTSTNSAGRGVNLDTIAGTFTVTGTTSVTGSTTEGVRVINSTAAINLGTLNVSGTTGTAVLIENNGGGSFTAAGGTVTKGGVAGDALDINGGAMVVNFGASISHTSNGGDAVSIRGGTTGNITVSGTVANTTGGRAIDINTVTSGTVSFTGATVTDAVGIQISNVAAGANVDFSAGTTVTLNSPGVPGINLSNNAGAITFNGAVDINNAGAGGIVLVNANANVTFGQVDIGMGAGAANTDAISIGGTPGTLTFGVTTITNVGGAAGQKGIDLSGANLGGAVNFQSVAISGPDTSTSSVGVDLTGVLGNQTVNMGTVGVADSTTDTPSSITDLHRGVVIDNTAAVQFTFGDGFGDGAPGGPDEASTINVNGQAGAFTVDLGGGTLGASSFDFNDVAFGAGDNANLPGAAGSAVFVSQTGGVIAAGTHGLTVSTGGGLNTITVAAAEALADNDQTFVFVAHDGTGTIDVGLAVTGGGADGFTLKDGQSLDGFDDGRVITFGTVQPANVEGNLGATGGNVTQNSVVASNSNAGVTSIVATAAGAGNSTIRNTVFDATGLGAGDAAISVDGAANAVTINNVEITNVGTGATAVLLNNNAGGVTLTDVDLFGANAGTALGIDAGGASTAAITVDAASDIDGTTGTIVSIGTGARNVTVNTNIAATGNTDNVIEIASQSGGAIQFGTVTSANATGNSVIETTAQSGGTLTFGNVSITGYGNAAADVAVELFGSGGTVTFADLDIATANGAGLAATGVGLTIAATSGDINVTGGAAVNLNGVTANTVSLTSITGNGSGTVADGIVLNNLGANSTFAVTGATTIDNYTDAGIQIANLANNNQDIDFGATDINRNTAVATGRGIVIDSIGGTGVDIDFGATQVGQGTVTTMGILVSGVGAGATGFRTDFASVNVNRARTGISIDNVDGGGVGVTGFARADNAQIANLTVQGSDANVTFAGTFGAQNNSGFDGRLVGIGNAVANTGTTTFVGQATLTASGTAAGQGVNLGGGTATFNGGLNIDTVTGTGLTATGGTLNVAATAGDESITTTSGQAVQIQNTTINAVFDSITGNGGGTAANGISFVATGGGSSFAVTGTTTLNNYTAESIVLDTILAAGQTFAFGAVDINTTAGQVQAGSDGISISTISALGVDIDFGAVTVGNATDQSDDGIRISSILGSANDIDIDFASLALTNLDDALHIQNFDAIGRTITVAGTTTIDDARTNGIRIFSSLGNVTFGGRTTILNDAAGANASGVDLGTSAGGANAGAYTFNGVDITVNGAGAFGFRATNSGTVTISDPGGNNQITSNNGTAVFINPTVTAITLQNITSSNATGSGVDLTLATGSTFTVTGTTAVTGSDQAGVEITNSGGSTVSLGTLNIDNDGAAADGAGLVVNQGGTGTLNLNASAGTIASGNDSAIDIRNTSTGGVNLGVGLTSVSVNGAAEGINIENTGGGTLTGALNTGTGGSITGTTSSGVDVEGAGAQLTIGQSITNTAGRAVEVSGQTGAMFTHSGNISSTGATLTAISVQSNTGGTIRFTGTTKTIDTSASNQNAVQITNNGATVQFTNGGLDIDTNNGTGFIATGGGTVNVSGANNTIQTASGTVIDADGVTLGATFASAGASALNGNTGINLQNLAGSLTVQGGTITNSGNADAIAIGSATNASGGNATINIATNVNSSGSIAGAATIRELTGGSVTLSGNLVDDAASGGYLIVRNIDNGTAATVTFSGTSKQISKTAGDGVILLTNPNGTVDFTNGGLDIDTTTGNGFRATGGGTVTVQGTGNSVTSTTGTAVNISGGTTIGAAGVTFQSVSANGATNGIVLNNTGSGGFTVTGVGTTDGSGGTITGGTDNVNISNATDVSLSNMNLQNASSNAVEAATINRLTLDNVLIDNAGSHGLLGTSIRTLTLTDSQIEDNGDAASEHGVFITNLLRTSNIERNTFLRNAEVQFKVTNTTATAAAPAASQDIINILRNNFAQHTGAFFGDNVQIEAGSGANMDVNIGDGTALNANTFDTGQDGAHIIAGSGGTMDVTINRNTRTNGTGQGFNLQAGANSTLTFDVNNNTITDTGSSGINAVHVGTNDLTTTTGRIRNNTITRVGQINPGGSAFYIRAIVEGSGNHIVSIDNNNASGGTGFNNLNGDSGIFVRAGDPSNNGNLRMDATITNNNVSGAGFRTIEVIAGTSAGGTGEVLCANIAGNTAANGANGDDAIRLEQRNGTTFHIQGFAGNGTSETDIVNHLNTQNPASGTIDVRNAAGTVVINYSADTCNTP